MTPRVGRRRKEDRLMIRALLPWLSVALGVTGFANAETPPRLSDLIISDAVHICKSDHLEALD